MRIKRGLGKDIVWRELTPAFIIAVNSITWSTFILSVFSDAIAGLKASSNETFALFGIEYASIAASAIVGSLFFPSRKRTSLSIWMFIGTVTPLLLTTIPSNGTLVNSMISILFGISIGAGLPSTLSLFADSTNVENRGFLGGLTFSFVGLSTVFFVATMLFFGTEIGVLMVVFWRLAGLLLFLATYKTESLSKERTAPAYSRVLLQRDLILYLVPWIMFCLINWIETPLLENLFGDLFNLMGFIEVVIAGAFALVGGMIADYAGRKRVVMIGFVILGLDYAILSLSFGMQVSWYAYSVLDSMAWGMFAAVFFMTIWGDLSRNDQKEKYYTIGGLTYLLAMMLSEIVKPYVGMMPLGTAFSLASFFLFLAVLPLMYAPETLPEKRIRERELKEYVERAKKAKEKYP